MSVYVISGKLGNGKTLLAVSRIRHYLREGRRVATNLDLNLEAMLGPTFKGARCVRVPDKPTAADLDGIGIGADVLDESRYGLLVLDELATWLNSRQWADKDRQGVIDWLVHSRKKRWDVILIVQNHSMIDKQVREALLEYLVTCKRLDKIKVPFFGHIGKAITFGAWDGCVGRLHLGVVVYAAGAALLANAMVVERWIYRGTDLFKAYDTEQQFSSSYAVGLFSYLSPWDAVGRYLPARWNPSGLLRMALALLGVGPLGGTRWDRLLTLLGPRKASGLAFRPRRASGGPGGLSIYNKVRADG
jgi:hypothetical protein